MTRAAAVILNGTKIFFVNENAFIDGSIILLNKEPKNPPDWFILNIRV